MQTKEGPLQSRGPYSDKRPLQTLYDFYRLLHYIHARGSYRQGPIATSKGPYIIYRQGPHTGMQGDHKDKSPSRRGSLQTKRHYRKGLLTYKGPLQTRWHYRQGALIDNEFIQTKGLYSKGPLQTLCNFYRQGALHDI